MGNRQRALNWLLNQGAPKALEWLLNQGPQTVLLFAVLFCMCRLTPHVIAKIQEGYERIVTTTHSHHERQIQTIVDEFRADQERDRDLLIRLLDPIGPHKYSTTAQHGGCPYGPHHPD